MRRWLCLGLILLGMAVSSRDAYSADEQVATVMVDPVTVSIALQKGETKTGVFKVTNNNDEKMSVEVQPRDWFMAPENEDIQLRSWLTIEPYAFDIEPKSQLDVTYTVKLPDEAVGELAAMIAFKPKPKENQAVNLVFSVSLYAVIIGTDKVECELSNFKIWKFEDRNGLGIQLEFNNKGNIHVKPRMEVFIKDMYGDTLQKAEIPYGVPVYPSSKNTYDGAIYGFKLKPGTYKAVVETDFYNVGRKYTKTVYLIAGKGGKILGSSMTSPEDIKAEPEGKDGAVPQKISQETEAQKDAVQWTAPEKGAAEEATAPQDAQPKTMTMPRKQR